MKDLNLKNILVVEGKEYLVSTIATPIRHTWFKDDDRIIYETMIFRLICDDVEYSSPLFNERYHSAEEAIAEHSCIIKNLERFLPNKR